MPISTVDKKQTETDDWDTEGDAGSGVCALTNQSRLGIQEGGP